MEWGKRTMIFLDTHVIVWLYQKDISRMSEKVIEQIETNDISISPLVILELEYLFEIEKIIEHGNTIINYFRNKINLRVCKHPFEDVILQALDFKWIRDPFDRIITADAKLEDAVLLTKDKSILKNYDKAVW